MTPSSRCAFARLDPNCQLKQLPRHKLQQSSKVVILSVLTSDGGLGAVVGWMAIKTKAGLFSFVVGFRVPLQIGHSVCMLNSQDHLHFIEMLHNSAQVESEGSKCIFQADLQASSVMPLTGIPAWNNVDVQVSIVRILVFTIISIHNIMCTFIFTGRFKLNLSANWHILSGLLALPFLEMRNCSTDTCAPTELTLNFTLSTDQSVAWKLSSLQFSTLRFRQKSEHESI